MSPARRMHYFHGMRRTLLILSIISLLTACGNSSTTAQSVNTQASYIQCGKFSACGDECTTASSQCDSMIIAGETTASQCNSQFSACEAKLIIPSGPAYITK